MAYTALYEVNRPGFSENIYEIFDSSNQLAVAIQVLEGSNTYTYSDYGRNELTAVFGYQTDKAMCQVLDLKENVLLTPFEIKEADGKLIAVSPISSMFHKEGTIQVSLMKI